MSTFDDLKSASEKAVSSQIQKQEGWIKANRKALIIGAVLVVALVALSHFL